MALHISQPVRSDEVYQLYRGACGKEGDLIAERCRLWVRGSGVMSPLGPWQYPNKKSKLVGGFNLFYFHPYLGKMSNLTNIFSDGLVQPPTREDGPKQQLIIL